jgi:23S rRNA pseudouridine1911/1915/1917 synthase
VATLRFAVADEDAGSRLDRALASRSEIGTRSLAEHLVGTGAVTVDGALRAKSHRLEHGSVVVVELPARDAGLVSEPVTVELAYEDEHLVVVDKPAGIVMHPGAGTTAGTLAAQLVTLGAVGGDDPDRPGIVHRLDRDTSGLMLVAKGEPAQRQLQAVLRRREVEREYLALAGGRLESRTGTIDAPIGRDPRRRTRMSTTTDKPREARTHFEVEELLEKFTLVRVRLETGRTHQIRAHMAAIRHPLAGDRDYGGPDVPGLERQFLHSSRLALVLPWSGEHHEWRSELPADLRAALEAALQARGPF